MRTLSIHHQGCRCITYTSGVKCSGCSCVGMIHKVDRKPRGVARPRGPSQHHQNSGSEVALLPCGRCYGHRSRETTSAPPLCNWQFIANVPRYATHHCYIHLCLRCLDAHFGRLGVGSASSWDVKYVRGRGVLAQRRGHECLEDWARVICRGLDCPWCISRVIPLNDTHH